MSPTEAWTDPPAEPRALLGPPVCAAPFEEDDGASGAEAMLDRLLRDDGFGA